MGMLRRLFCTAQNSLQTQLIIRTGEYEGRLKVAAAGMLLQIMPDGSGTPEDFEHLTTPRSNKLKR